MTEVKTKNKSTLVIMVVVFILPVLLAYMALQFDWFNKASTNKGQLLEPIIDAQDLLAKSDNKWHLIYIVPRDCNSACENAIYSVEQIYQATGKESDRVSILFIHTQDSDQSAVQRLQQDSKQYLLFESQENVNEVFKNEGINAIFIADTLHNLILKYPVTPSKEDAILDSRDILADLKKLLKLSRIG